MAQTYLVTGATRGIGLEFCRQLAGRGDLVVATARQGADAKTLRDLGATVLTLDASDENSIRSLAEQLNGRPIDVLINNAGVSSETKTLDSLSLPELQRVFTVNAFAPLLVIRAALPNLARGERKAIVSITSQLASIANNTGGSTYAYRASKAALNMLNKSLANELGPKGFTCVAIHPGWVRTDMGGPDAPLSPRQAVESMLKVIDALPREANGAFLNYDGRPIPW